MSVFALKLIAVLSMVTDHSAWFLYLRGFIGVELFERSRDRVAYLSRLCLFAAVSQIPFAMLFTQSNFFIPDRVSDFYLAQSSALPALALVAVCAVWYFCVRRDLTALSPLPALVLGLLRLELAGVWVLSGKLNVFYTLSIGLAFMCLVDRLAKREKSWYSSLLCAGALGLVVWLVGGNIDYSFGGLALLALLSLTRRSRLAQALVICLWSLKTYPLSSPH